MLKTLWEYILQLLGRKESASTKEEWTKNMQYAQDFENSNEINFTAIFANKLTTLAVSESTADVVGENARVAFLDECLTSVWRRMKRITSRMLGTGGCALVPYVQNGKVLFSIISQDRLMIHEKQGEKIVAATVLADSAKRGTQKYFRWVDYRVSKDMLLILNRVTDESGRATSLTQWEGIEDRAIAGVDRVPLAYFKSPVDNRTFGDYYGVPITYGCKSIIDEIRECLLQIQDEFKLKKVKVFADEMMFRKDPKTGEFIMDKDLFFASRHKDDGSLIDIFSPEIRESSYYSRLQALFDILEKSIGTSKGILTAPESRGATATEIKAGLYDTYAMITDIRFAIESGMQDYIYACNVFANYFGLAPMGEYELAFDWSYSLIESSAESWAQLKDAQALGVKSKEELRQWLNPNETADEAKAAIGEIKKNEPTVSDLLGG